MAVSAIVLTLDTEIDSRFDACPYFIIAEIETDKFGTVGNSSATAAGGAGISAAQMITDKGI